MPLDKFSNESIIQSISDYITKANTFYSTHPTTANRWCLGIMVEDEKTASQLETYLCNIIQDRTIRIYSNKSASQWCDGKYNVVIVTQYTREDVERFKAEFNK